MRILGLRRLFTLTSWLVILANPFPVPAFAGSGQDLQTKTPISRQPTSAQSRVLQAPFVAFPIPSTLTPSTPEQTGEVQVVNDSPNDDVSPKNREEPRRRALPAPLDSIFPSSDYLGPSPLIGVPDTDPIYPLTRALWSTFLRSREPKSRFMVGGI